MNNLKLQRSVNDLRSKRDNNLAKTPLMMQICSFDSPRFERGRATTSSNTGRDCARTCPQKIAIH